MKLNRKTLRRMILNEIRLLKENKDISQLAVLDSLSLFFGYTNVLQKPNKRIGGKSAEQDPQGLRAFYKIMSDNNLTVNNDDLDVLFNRLSDIDAPHSLSGDKPVYSLDENSLSILKRIYSLNKKLKEVDFDNDMIYDFAQKKKIGFSHTYHGIKNKDKNYLTIPKLR